MRRNGARRTTSNTSSKLAYIIPIAGQLRYYIHAVEKFDEDAAVAVNEKDVFRCLIGDALNVDDPRLERRYNSFIDEYGAFGIDRMDIMALFEEVVFRLEELFRDNGVHMGSRYSFTWLPNSRNVFIYEED